MNSPFSKPNISKNATVYFNEFMNTNTIDKNILYQIKEIDESPYSLIFYF